MVGIKYVMKHIFTLLVLFCIQPTLLVKAQLFKAWDKTFGSSLGDKPTAVIQLKDSGYLFIGYTNGGVSGDKTAPVMGPNYTKCDFWVIKVDKFGAKVWDKTIGGTKHDCSYAAKELEDGTILIFGESESDIGGNKNSPNLGKTDFWLVKLTKNGTKLLDRVYGESFDDGAFFTIPPAVWNTSRKIINTGGNKFLIYGSSKSVADIRDFYDYWIIQIDEYGTVQWQKRYGSDGDDILQSVVKTNDGGFVLCGYSNSPAKGDKSQGSLGVDIWLVKIDSIGNKLWDKTLGSTADDYAVQLVACANGDIMVATRSLGGISGTKQSANISNEDIWLLKLNPNGQVIWDKTIGGNKNECPTDMIVTPDGGYLIQAYSYSDSAFNKTENNMGGTDRWFIKIDDSGNIIYDKSIGGNHSDDPTSLINTFDYAYFSFGLSYSDTNRFKSENCRGYNDYWGIKLFESFILQTQQGYCFTDSLKVKVVLNNAQPNTVRNFIFQLSDEAGKFVNPKYLGTYNTSSHQFNTAFKLPLPIASSKYYRIRAIVDLPQDTFYFYGDINIDVPPSSLIVTRNVLCNSNDSLVLTSTNTSTNQWFYNGVLQSTQTKFVVSKPGQYVLKSMSLNGFCKTSDSIYINSKPSFNLLPSADTSFCEGTQLQLIVNNQGNPFQYIWNTGERTQLILIDTIGLYKVTATDSSCTYQDSVRVNKFKITPPNLPSDEIICFEKLKKVILDAGVYKKYYWEPTGEKTRIIYASTVDDYIVSVVDFNNCIAYDTCAISEHCPVDLYVPSAFTPNGEGLNDNFKVVGADVIAYEIQIYNRYGENVFTSTDITKPWDGTFKQEPCASDVYTWLIQATIKGMGPISKKGTVTLLR